MMVVAVGALLAPTAVGATDGTKGVITGLVTDEAGDPIGPESGICVLPGNSTGGWSNLEEDGTYRIEVDPGVYAVRFLQCTAPQAPIPYYAPEYYPNLHAVEEGKVRQLPNVTVRAGATTSGINATLEIGGSLAVTVKDSSGSPRQGICVGAEKLADNTSLWVHWDDRPKVGYLPENFGGTSDTNGLVSLKGLIPGKYFLRAKPCDRGADLDLPRIQFSGGVFAESAATTVFVQVGKHTVAPDFVMAEAATVTGQVTHDGIPVAGSCVEWEAPWRDGSSRVITDASGHYTIGGLTPTIPTTLKACSGSSSPDQWWDGPLAPMWFGGGATRSTSTDLVPVAGSVTVWNPDLLQAGTMSVIVTSLRSPQGCKVKVVDAIRNTYLVPLREGGSSGIWFADAFGVTGRSAATLECNGIPAGSMTPVPEFSPLIREHGNWGQDLNLAVVEADNAGPKITPVGTPTAWTNKAVRVSFACSDPAGVTSCPASQVFAEGTSLIVSAVDKLGNKSSLKVGPLHIDATPPAIRVRNKQRTFKSSDIIDLGCEVTDPRSGLKALVVTCPRRPVKASTLGVGDHQFHLSGTDKAGNKSSAVVKITIVK